MLQPHIQLDESCRAACAILPGDPGRITRIAEILDGAEELGFHREYRSIRGTWKGVPVLAMSTGMGGSSTAIAVEELCRIGVRTMIRIGSCGALSTELQLGELILVQGAVRDDGASAAYVPPQYPAVSDPALLRACERSARCRGIPGRSGIVRSHESFYSEGQEETDRAWSRRGILGADMETACLLTVGRLRGVRAMSILNTVVRWGEDTVSGIGTYAEGENRTAEGERNSILVALDACAETARGEGEALE